MSTSRPDTTSAGRPLSVGAIVLMLMLCLSWGFNQIAVKLALPDIPPFLQAFIRSCGAIVVLLVIARLRGVRLFERDGTLGAGLVAGMLFGFEFVLIYHGLLLTTASRAVVFIYTAPFFVALGSYRFLGERLRASQWGGLGLCFVGVAFAIGVPQPDVDGSVLLGDVMIVGGAHLGSDHAAGEGDLADRGAAGEDAELSGRRVDPDSGRRSLGCGRDPDPDSRAAVAVADGLSGSLGGGSDIFDMVFNG